MTPDNLWRAWSYDPGILAPLLLTAWLYGRGATRTHGVSRNQQLCFWAGWIVLCLALLSPLHPLGEALFSAHMLQHELLMVLVAPLLVVARPLVALLWGMPFQWRRTLGQWSRRRAFQTTRAFVTHPMTAWCVHAAALWVWHIPRLFQATLNNDWIHSAQHISFLGSALLFWWSLFYAHGRSRYGASVLYLFTTAVHTSILGALLTFATTVWYQAYVATTAVWGLTPLEDQQTGGLIMWIPAGLVYVIGGLALLALWLRESDRVANLRLSLLVLLMLGGCSLPHHVASTGGDAASGAQDLFRLGCGTCHTIPDIVGAHGQVGPSLQDFADRSYVAGQLPNQPLNLEHWIQHPHSVHPDSVMPELGITDQESRDVAAYLYLLK